MTKVLKHYTFNQDANLNFNKHMYLMCRANLGVALRDSPEINIDKKNELMNSFQDLESCVDFDCYSFRLVLYEKLFDLEVNVKEEPVKCRNFINVIEGLIKFHKLEVKMKTFIVVFSLLGLVSCSSTDRKNTVSTDELVAHMSQEPKVIGKDWDPKFLKDGFINGEYVAIGSSNSSNLDYYNRPARVLAESVAMGRLLKSAPTDFKRIVQSAINTANGDQGNVQESQISITEVRALTGIKSNFDDVQCVTTGEPNRNMNYNFYRECRVILRVPSEELMKAYDFTLDNKYSIKQKNDIKNLMLNEMNKTVEPLKQENKLTSN